ncbi:pseudouridine synthase [Caballeronia sp. LZ043]|uniref:pseudouridine synthase n=2 Tax=unclassified Caballeronia TaxID=2646786 RepID=UPI0028642BC2|nr:pseudouridine synthase [Caballeronia sp. LZ043]MDR5819964.1 pseudouridine synthase [Caballeronia sp. LZ043]
MRVKLTAKHPRPTSATRSPVRTGTSTGRKPARPAVPDEARPARAKPSAGEHRGDAPRKSFEGRPPARGERAAGGDKRRTFKPRGDDSRPAFGERERGPRKSFEGRPPARGERAAGGDERRPFKPRGDDSRPTFGERERGPRKSFEGRPPARGERPAGGDERRPFKPRGDDSRPPFGDRERGPRKSFEGRPPARGERAAGGDERRTFKPRGDDSRPAFGERGPRKSFEGRPPARGERPAGGDERRPFKPRGDDSRAAFGDRERGPRKSFEGRPPARGERPAGDEERRTFKPRGDDSRPAFGDRERGPRKSFEGRPPARGERPAGDEERRTFKPRGDDTRPSFGDRERGPRKSFGADARSGPAPRKNTESRAPARASHTDTRQPPAAESAPKHRDHDHHDGLVRLSKVMSELGLCSRREADEWIEKGWVLVDGEVIDTLGTRIRPTAEIDVLPAARSAQSQRVTILLHKPVGYVSGQAEDGYEPAVTLITPANRWEEDRAGIRFAPSHLRTLAPAGRLDIDSTGLLVLTQDGRIAKQLIGGHSEVDKEYLVRVRLGDHTVDVDKHLPAEQLALLRHGLELDGVPLKTAQVSWQNGEQLRFVLREGKKRQIRRMCELVGLEVVGLKRIRMGGVTLGNLPPGQWRYLGPNESF